MAETEEPGNPYRRGRCSVLTKLGCFEETFFYASVVLAEKEESWNPYRRGRLSTVHPLVVTSLDKFILILKIVLIFVTNQATLMRR